MKGEVGKMNNKKINLRSEYKNSNNYLLKYVIWGLQFFNTFIIPIIITVLLFVFNKNDHINKLIKNVLNYQLTLLLYFTLGIFPLFIIYELELNLSFTLILAFISIVILSISSIIYFVYPILGITYIQKNKTFKSRFVIQFIK